MTETSVQLIVTAGSWLKQQREQAQISVEGISDALKVHPHRLMALEADNWDRLPDTLFIRSLALGVCRHLRADEKTLLPLLPALPQRDLNVMLSNMPSIPLQPKRWSGPMLFNSLHWVNTTRNMALAFFGLLLVLFLLLQWDSGIPSTASITLWAPDWFKDKSNTSFTPAVQAVNANQIDIEKNLKTVITPVVPMAFKSNSGNSTP